MNERTGKVAEDRQDEDCEVVEGKVPLVGHVEGEGVGLADPGQRHDDEANLAAHAERIQDVEQGVPQPQQEVRRLAIESVQRVVGVADDLGDSPCNDLYRGQ